MEIWGMDVSPKVKHLIGDFENLLTNFATRTLLKHRHMLDVALCPWCESGEETSLHAPVLCLRVRSMCSECGCEVLARSAVEDWRETLLGWSNGDAKVRQCAAIFLWNLWMERNQKEYRSNNPI